MGQNVQKDSLPRPPKAVLQRNGPFWTVIILGNAVWLAAAKTVNDIFTPICRFPRHPDLVSGSQDFTKSDPIILPN